MIGKIRFRRIRTSPNAMLTDTVLKNGRVARRSNFLNEGYLTSLTIIMERKIRINGSAYRQLPVGKLLSSTHIRNRVSDATSPAAAGMGKPRNSLPPPLLDIAARQLK